MSELTRRGLLGVTAAVAVAGCNEALETPYEQPTDIRTRQPNATVQPAGTPPSGAFRSVYEAVAPSVAAIRADDGLGSCYARDEQHLVTNEHVVTDSNGVRVQYADDDWGAGTVAATDVYSDLAVVRDPDRPGYVAPLSLADYAPAVGQEAAAVGAPFGLRSSFTVGTISGVNRVLEAPTGFAVPGAVQTDAAVNPGNSGGPMVSLAGEVLGVVSAAGSGENLGFGVPPQLVRRVVPDLLEFGDYQHPFLGVPVAEVTPPVAAANDVPARGVMVVDVRTRGPVDGVLRPATRRTVVEGQEAPVGGDVILAFDGATVGSTADLLTRLAFRTFPGDEVAATVVRDGTEVDLQVPIGVRPPP